MRFRPLIAVAAAAGLLAAGCDYWRNLVDGKTVASARLRVKVQDKFTGEHLVAVCTDSTRGLILETSLEDGQVETLSAGTGMYTMRCRAPWGYYDKIAIFPLTPAGDTVIFDLARLGGEEEWYPGHALLDVRIRETFDTLRFPRDLNFNAYPEDTTGLNRFRYEWTLSKAKGLDVKTNEDAAKFPLFSKKTNLGNVVPGPDTLTLRVWSFLNGPVPYYIGMDKQPFVWALNQRPTLDLDVLDTLRQYVVGCSDDQPLRVRFRGVDPDGECKSVRFYTHDSTSAFGAVETTLQCFEKSPEYRPINFNLKDRYDYLHGDTTVLRPNTLNITVTDDNGETYETSIKITTRSNKPPTVVWGVVGTRVPLKDDSVKIWFEVSDTDGSPRDALVNWIDEGQWRLPHELNPKIERTVRDTMRGIVRTPGVNRFRFFVTDNCNGGLNAPIDSIFVRDYSAPDVTFEFLHNEGTAQDPMYAFRLIATDKDIREGLKDSITNVFVDWNGEGTRHVASPNLRSTYDTTLTHNFSSQPDSLGRFKIIVYVYDAHEKIGTATTYFRIP